MTRWTKGDLRKVLGGQYRRRKYKEEPRIKVPTPLWDNEEERLFFEFMELRVKAKELLWFKRKPIRLRCDDTWSRDTYKPDGMGKYASIWPEQARLTTIFEYKGRMRAAGMKMFRWARREYKDVFRFEMWQKTRQGGFERIL